MFLVQWIGWEDWEPKRLFKDQQDAMMWTENSIPENGSYDHAQLCHFDEQGEILRCCNYSYEDKSWDNWVR